MSTHMKIGKTGQGGEKNDSRVEQERGKREVTIKKREICFCNPFVSKNYINSWFDQYEPARFRILGNSGQNHLKLSPTLASKSPNLTRIFDTLRGTLP